MHNNELCINTEMYHKNTLSSKLFSVLEITFRRIVIHCVLNKQFSFKVQHNILVSKEDKLANLIGKLNFYKLIPYPMDNSLSGRRRPARQTSEKDVLVCTRQMACRTSFLSRQSDVIASFLLSKPIRPLVD